MRRKDREVADFGGIIDILSRCDILRIALCDGDKPYIVPMNFAFETIGERLIIYLHCAREGRKIDLIKKNGSVCFEANCSYRLVRHENPAEWTSKYESVIGEGKIEITDDTGVKRRAMDALMARHGYEGEPAYSDAALSKVAVLRIAVDTVSGKRNL